MSLKVRLKKLEELLKDSGYGYKYQGHPHVAKAHQINGKLYNRDGTEFIDNHPEDCPILFIVVTRGEESNEVPA